MHSWRTAATTSPKIANEATPDIQIASWCSCACNPGSFSAAAALLHIPTRHDYLFLTLSMVSMGAFEAWADGCRRACVDSHEIDDLEMGSCWQGEAPVQRSLITGFTLRVDGQCTVSSLPQSLSTCFCSDVCKIFRETNVVLHAVEE